MHAPGAHRSPHADLAATLQHGDDHHVGDPDAADDQGHGAQGEQEVAQRRVGGGPRLERVRRPRHVHLVRRVGADRTGEHAPDGLDLVGRGAHEQRRRRRGGVEQRRPRPGTRSAPPSRAPERAAPDRGCRSPRTTRRRATPAGCPRGCGCRGGGRRRRRAPRSAGARTPRRGTGRRGARRWWPSSALRSAATTRIPPVTSSSMRSVRRTVASTPVIPAADRDRPDARRRRRAPTPATSSSRRTSSGPAAPASRSVPRASMRAMTSARLDDEMPTTATIAAMPMAIPRAVSSVRNRRERSPATAVRARSTGRSRVRRDLHAATRSSSTTTPSRSDTRRRRARGDLAVVGDQHDGAPGGVQVDEQRRRSRRWSSVEVAGGLVGEDDRRLGDQGAGDADPLALAARQRARAALAVGAEVRRRRAPPRRGAAVRGGRRRRRAGRSATFSRAVSPRRGGTAGTRTRCAGRARAVSWRSRERPTSWPSMRTVPVVGRCSAPTTFISVDLPDPDGPTIATNSPWPIVRSMPRAPSPAVCRVVLVTASSCSAASLVHRRSCDEPSRWWCTNEPDRACARSKTRSLMARPRAGLRRRRRRSRPCRRRRPRA